MFEVLAKGADVDNRKYEAPFISGTKAASACNAKAWRTDEAERGRCSFSVWSPVWPADFFCGRLKRRASSALNDAGPDRRSENCLPIAGARDAPEASTIA